MKKLLTLSVSLLLLLALTACTSGQPTTTAKPVILTSVYDEIGKSVTLPENMVEVKREELMANYGIAEADVNQSCVYVSGDPTRADEIALFQAVDSEAAARIQDKLETRHDAKAEEANGYSAEQYAIIMKCPVERSGYYVSLIVSPDQVKIMETYTKYIK